MKSLFRPALVLFALLTLVCGVLYPLAVTGIGQLFFADQAAGSLVYGSKLTNKSGNKPDNVQPLGSRLIGQSFSAPQYFWGRPSATSPMPDNAAASGGANLGPTNPAQIDAVQGRIAALKAADPGNDAAVPVDLVTASASGLDPDISLAAAYYQAGRIARSRSISVAQVRSLIEEKRQSRYLGFFGEPRVNVLALNLALEQTR